MPSYLAISFACIIKQLPHYLAQLEKSRDFLPVVWKNGLTMRYLYTLIDQFVSKKMIFLSGARQVGKTTLGQAWLKSHQGAYYSWDDSDDRAAILKKEFLAPAHESYIMLDELHKYQRWKNFLKGIYDKHGSEFQMLVSGSAHLDVYQKAGDSLFGRYELLRLHPLSIGELTHGTLKPPPTDWLVSDFKTTASFLDIWKRLKTYGGFPEPYHESDDLHHRRWSTRRRELLVREDLRDITEIRLLELVEHLYLLLPSRVAAPLSINSLREELQVAHDTISSWISVLERLYICFRLKPYHQKIARSLKKENKLYFTDWSQIPEPGSRFENIVAAHLLKSIHAWNDVGYGDFGLYFWRNKEKEEVDFVVTNNTKPIALIECKLADTSISRSLLDLSHALGDLPCIQLVDSPDIYWRKERALVVSAAPFLANFT